MRYEFKIVRLRHGEHRVSVYDNGKYSEKDSYYTDDYDDAVNTMADMDRRMNDVRGELPMSETYYAVIQMEGRMRVVGYKKPQDAFDHSIQIGQLGGALVCVTDDSSKAHTIAKALETSFEHKIKEAVSSQK